MLVSQWGVTCAKGRYFTANDTINADALAADLGMPLFIKPSRSGSSYGVTRVNSVSQISSAIAEAKKEDAEIVAEAAVIGTEVGCGVARKRRPVFF